MLIDWSYFTDGPRHILNNASGKALNAQTENVLATVNGFIEQYQEEFLTRMLGSALGNKVHTYLICCEDDGNSKPCKSFDAVCSHLRESFADYVFYKFLADTNTQATITGLVRIKNANTPVSPLRRQVHAWNAMVNKNRLFAAWCKTEDCPLSGILVSDAMITKINSLNL